MARSTANDRKEGKLNRRQLRRDKEAERRFFAKGGAN